MNSNIGLEDLFKQIGESERNLQKNKDLLNEVRMKNAVCNKDIQEAKTETRTCQEFTSVKNQEFSELEVKKQFMVSKVHLFQEQRDLLQSRKQELDARLASVKAETSGKRDYFRSQVEEFLRGYDLCSNGKLKRESVAKEQISKLRDEEQKLQRELLELHKSKADLERLWKEKCQMDELTFNKRQQANDLEVQLEKETKRSQDLEAEKTRLSELPRTDPEFLRLQQEVGMMREDNMESVCAEMQQELQQLQQQQWQRRQLQRRLLPMEASSSIAQGAYTVTPTDFAATQPR